MNARINFSTRRKLEDYLLELFYDITDGREFDAEYILARDVEDVKDITDDEKFSIIKYIALSEKNVFNRFLVVDDAINVIEDWLMDLDCPIELYASEIKKRFNLDKNTYWRALAEIVYYNA